MSGAQSPVSAPATPVCPHVGSSHPPPTRQHSAAMWLTAPQSVSSSRSRGGGGSRPSLLPQAHRLSRSADGVPSALHTSAESALSFAGLRREKTGGSSSCPPPVRAHFRPGLPGYSPTQASHEGPAANFLVVAPQQPGHAPILLPWFLRLHPGPQLNWVPGRPLIAQDFMWLARSSGISLPPCFEPKPRPRSS